MTHRKLADEVNDLLKDWKELEEELKFNRKKLLLIDISNYIKKAEVLKRKIQNTDRRYISLISTLNKFLNKLKVLNYAKRQVGQGRKKTRRKSRRKTRRKSRRKTRRKTRRKSRRKTRRKSRRKSRKKTRRKTLRKTRRKRKYRRRT